jgi:hypothetical protein
VQVGPIKPTLKPPVTKHFKLQHDHLLSKLAFKSDLRRYTLDYYDALQNVSLGSGGAKNVLRCQLAPSSSDASEAFSKWTQLEVAVRSSKPEHEVRLCKLTLD